MAQLANFLSLKHSILSAGLLTFSFGNAAFADLKNESPTRIKRDEAVQKTKTTGYHNQVGSPSREPVDEFYLLVPEEPKTDEERSRRRFEAAQLAKILTVLKAGNFGKAQHLLSELAQSMPVDSESRSLYQRLASMCADRMDTEYWYRYDIKDRKRLKETRLSIAQLPRNEKPAVTPSSQAVQSLRKEAWLLLTVGNQTK